MTDNRNTILDLVLHAGSHPTADDIYQQLRSNGRRVTLATVYNNLNTLCEEGSIQRVSFNERSERYDKPDRHDHLVCKSCGKISDISLEDFTKMLEACSGVTLEGYDLKLLYICDACRKQKATLPSNNVSV